MEAERLKSCRLAKNPVAIHLPYIRPVYCRASRFEGLSAVSINDEHASSESGNKQILRRDRNIKGIVV